MFQDSTIQKISIGATIILLLSWSVFKAFWYMTIFGFGHSTNVTLAVLISLAWEGVNFSLILSSMRDFERGHLRTAIFGMAVSVLIGVYDSIEARSVVTTLADGHYLFALSTIWVVRFLELRISLLLVDSKKALKAVTAAPTNAPSTKREGTTSAPIGTLAPSTNRDNTTAPSAPRKTNRRAPTMRVETPTGTYRLMTLRQVQSTLSTYRGLLRKAEETEEYDTAARHKATIDWWEQREAEMKAAAITQ